MALALHCNYWGPSFLPWPPIIFPGQRWHLFSKYLLSIYHVPLTIYCGKGKKGKTRAKVVPGLIQFSSVTQSCLTLCNSMNRSTPGLPVHHQLPEFIQIHVIESVMPSNHLILCRPLLPPSIFPSIRVFSIESALSIRWSKYWSFSFIINPSNEYSGLISFRTD